MNMRIIVVADIHNDVENLIPYFEKVHNLDVDVIVCPGDFTDFNLPKGFSRVEMTKLIIEELKNLEKPIVAVPGNQDREIISLLEEENISVHGKGKIINNIGFYGFGGAKTPFGSPYEPDENEIKNGLKRGYDDVKDTKVKIQITHSPPANTKLDIIPSGAHVGSEAVRKFIEEKQPLVAVAAHVHESRGIDTIGNCKIINSGRFPEGYCGLIEIKDNMAEAKVISLI